MIYFSIRIFKCNYDKTPDKCAKKEEIDYEIAAGKLFINIVTLENILTVANYEKPINPTSLVYYKFLNSEAAKVEFYGVQQQFLVTDSAIFSNSIETKEFLKLVKTDSDFMGIDPINKEMMRFNFYGFNKSDRFYRKYIKLTEILASVGGLLKVFMMVFKFIDMQVIKIKKYVILQEATESINDYNNVNDSNNFNDKNNFNYQNNIINASSLVPINIQITQKVTNLDKQEIKNLKILQNNNNKVNVFNKNNKQKNNIKIDYSLSIKDYIKAIFYDSFGKRIKGSQRLDILAVYKIKIDKIMDYVTMIKNTKKLEILEKIIFTDKQNKMFNCLNDNDYYFNNYNEIKEFINKTKNEGDTDIITKNLANLLINSNC
jgi:hypothetical protein